MRPPLFQNHIYVKKSSVHGYGVFAGKDIKAGEMIEEAHGICFEKTENLEGWTNYYFNMGKMAFFALGYGSIYNHSDYFNATYKFDAEHSLLIFSAARDIKKDEEILVSYGKNWFSSREIQQIETSWRYLWDKIRPVVVSILRFIIVTALLFTIIRFKLF